eukprot:3680488-Prymnesium_polylepis.1
MVMAVADHERAEPFWIPLRGWYDSACDQRWLRQWAPDRRRKSTRRRRSLNGLLLVLPRLRPLR